MNARDKKQATFLGGLIVILGVTLYVAPGLNRAPTASGTPPPPGAQQQPSAVDDARIRLDLLNPRTDGPEAGAENLFQYRIVRPPPGPARPTQRVEPFVPAPQAYTPPVHSGPPPPPPPPPIPLRYQGYARSEYGTGELTAFLVDDTRHYNVKAGEVLMGRYRITAITDTSVQVEDMQFRRTQTLALQK